ncbi:GGDEF domain-containing protein [Jiella sp. MQZ9-1]|uniref:diguanylate cyclase n=1 Tax=Jiella flava TaxID=2816857 RepID=A0A939JVG8_9HYPH|nr:GGDEF domain-containing protein [Jiella flava]MBO0661266.1 GGDEF domain-containing protein [Jiella flava]MCD2469911.1 GGDEF domain-containing protein [Jiella flava]
MLATLFGSVITLVAVAAMLSPMTQAAAALEAYADDRSIPDLPTQYHDLAGRLMARVQSTLLELDRRIGKLEDLSTTDPLTGLYNRRWVADRAPRLISDSKAEKRLLSLLVIDVDKFKQLNDAHGHTLGDQVLILVADAIRGSIRGTDYAVRVGGDEFCVFLPRADRPSAEDAAKRIRDMTRISTRSLLDVGAVTLSIGVATLRLEDEELDDLFNRADENLYRAKREGRDRSISG